MAFADWLKRLGIRAAGRIPATPPDWLIRPTWVLEAGLQVTSETATQVSAVYGCCRLIVDSLAAAPIQVFSVERAGRRTVLPDDPVGYTLNWGAPLAIAPDAPTAQSIEESLFWSALLTGNGYAEIQLDGAGRFFSLWPLDPDYVIPKRDSNTGEFYYQVTAPQGGSVVRASPDRIFHLRGPSLYGWVGDSTVYRASKAIGIAQAAAAFASSYFSNGTIIGGLLSSDKMITADQAKRAKEQWNQDHRGPDAAHGLAVLGQGLKYQALNHDAQQSQMIEAQRFSVQQIARFFGVPTTLLADNEAWTNLDSLYLGFFRSALLPWAARFDAEVNRKCFPQRQPWREAQHDLTDLILGSFKERVEALNLAVRGGLWSRNEAREVMGKNSVPDGDDLVMDGNVKSLDDVLDPPEPPPPAVAKTGDAGEEPGDEGGDQKQTAREAAALMYSQAFGRYASRIKRKSDPDWAWKTLERECIEASSFLQKYGIAPPNGSLQTFAGYVRGGEPPQLAANRMLGIA